MNDGALAIARLAALALSLFIIPSWLVPSIARASSLSWRRRLTANWLLTLVAAGLVLLVLLWSTSLVNSAVGTTGFLLGAAMLMAVGWGGQYMAFNRSLEILRVSLLVEGKEVPDTLMERVKSRAEPPKCRDGSTARLVELPSVTGTFAVSDRGMPIDPSSPRVARSYSLTFIGLTAYTCGDQQSELRPPARRFAPELVAWICAYGNFPRLKEGHCTSCGAAITTAERAPFGRIEATVELPYIAPFQVIYEGPVFVCPACWTRHIGSTDQCDGIGEALMIALHNANIKERWQDRIFG